MTVPGRYRSAATFDVTFADKQGLPARARRDFLMHAPFEVRIGGDGDLRARHGGRVGVGLALDELHAVGDAGGDLGAVHADPDLQRQGQRRRLPGDRDQLPRGHDRQPGRRRGLDRDRLGVPAAGLHRLPAHALAGAPGARVHRGGDRLLLVLRERDPGRRHRPVRQLLGDHELRDRGAGDGGEVRARRHRHLRGDVQPRGRRRRRRDVGADLPDGLPVAPASRPPAAGRAATAAARASSRCWWSGRRPFWELQNLGTTRVFSAQGLFGGYPGSAAYVHNIKGADLVERARARRGVPALRRRLRRPGPDRDRGRADLQAGQLHHPGAVRRGRPLPVGDEGGAGARRSAAAPARGGGGRRAQRATCCRASPNPSTAWRSTGTARPTSRRARRGGSEMRRERLERAVPVREWWERRAGAGRGRRTSSRR